MDFQQIRDFVNPAVAQATGLQEVENLSMPVPVAYVPVQLVIDGDLSLTSENPVQNKVIAVAIQNLDGRITAVEGQFAEGVTEAVNNWLAVHPEATTTVQDCAISYAKLDTNLKGKVDEISDLKSAIDELPKTFDSDAENVDLDISDASGNVIFRIKQGHIQSGSFFSADIARKYAKLAKSNTQDADLDISDPSGNVILRISNGILRTKNVRIGSQTITVKSDGTGDFTSLRYAVESIIDADADTNPYTIEIYPGTYNVFSDYSAEEIQSSGFQGLMVGDGIRIVGIGNRDDIIINGELSTVDYDSTLRNEVSTLNFMDTATLENVTVVAKNIRYCVHDDYPPTRNYFKRVVKNCKFRGYGLTSGTQQKTWGEGSRQGKTTILEDCDFGTCMLWHSDNTGSATRPSKLIVKNCTALLALIDCRNHHVLHQIYLYGNNFGIISHTFQNVSSEENMMNVIGTGKNSMISAPADFNFVNGDIVRFRNNGTLALTVGQLVLPSSTPYWVSGTLSPTSDPLMAYGVIVGLDSEWFYVQIDGYININRFGFSNLSLGDKITVTQSGTLEVNGSGETFGIVCCVTNLYGSYMRRMK